MLEFKDLSTKYFPRRLPARLSAHAFSERTCVLLHAAHKTVSESTQMIATAFAKTVVVYATGNNGDMFREIETSGY